MQSLQGRDPHLLFLISWTHGSATADHSTTRESSDRQALTFLSDYYMNE